jgi:hypothetical protein
LAGGLVEEQASPAANSVPAQPASPTSRNNEQYTPAAAPAAPATSPTSSGQPVGAASAATNTNAESGGTQVVTRTESTVSELTFAQNVPTGYQQYVEFRNQQAAALREKYTAEAIENFGSIDARTRSRIATISQSQATIAANQRFATQIQAAGAGTVTNTTNPAAQQGAAVPQAPQTINRDY